MIHFLVIWLLPVLVGALAGFWLAGRLGKTWIGALLMLGLAITLVSFFLATTSGERAWAVIPYFSALGFTVGLAGKTLFRGSRIVTALAVLVVACAAIFVLFQAGCAWSGQCM